MSNTTQIKPNPIMLLKYHNFSFCRQSGRVFRSNFGSNVEIKKDASGRFKIKKNGEAYYFCHSELMRDTQYAAKMDRIRMGS